MYEQIGIRALNESLSSIIGEAERGHGRVITRRNRAIAAIVPIRDAEAAGLVEQDEATRRRLNRERNEALRDKLLALGELDVSHADLLESVYGMRKHEPDRVGAWASSLTQASS